MTEPTRTLLPSTASLEPTTRLAAAGFLARYTDPTRSLYESSLAMFFDWALANGLEPLRDTRRAHLELFVRHLEQDRGNSPATVNNRLAAIAGFYKFAEIDEYITRSPATYVRRPKMWREESKTVALNSVELMKLMDAAAASDRATDAALVALLGMMGLRVSEATNVRIEDFAETKRGHRVLRLVGKGGRPATVPIPPFVLRQLERAAGDRDEGWLLVRPDWGRATAGQRMTARAARIAVTRLLREARIEKRVTPHGLRHSYITAGLDLGVPLRDMQIAARHSDPRTTAQYDRNRQNLDRQANHVISANLAGAA